MIRRCLTACIGALYLSSDNMSVFHALGTSQSIKSDFCLAQHLA